MNSANKSDIGNFYEFLKAVSERNPRELSFLNASWKDLKQWRSAAQKKVLELLSYFPPEGPLDATTVCASEHHDYWQEEVEFNTSAFTRARGAVLIPKKGKNRSQQSSRFMIMVVFIITAEKRLYRPMACQSW